VQFKLRVQAKKRKTDFASDCRHLILQLLMPRHDGLNSACLPDNGRPAVRHLSIYLRSAGQFRHGAASLVNMSTMSEHCERTFFDLYDQNSGLVPQFEPQSKSIFLQNENRGWVDFVWDRK